MVGFGLRAADIPLKGRTALRSNQAAVRSGVRRSTGRDHEGADSGVEPIEGWYRSMSTPTGFGLAGIIGMPVVHSRSPTIHNFWLNAHGLRGAYLPLAVRPERLKDALP